MWASTFKTKVQNQDIRARHKQTLTSYLRIYLRGMDAGVYVERIAMGRRSEGWGIGPFWSGREKTRVGPRKGLEHDYCQSQSREDIGCPHQVGWSSQGGMTARKYSCH